MKKLSLATYLLIGLVNTSASAVTFTLGDVFNGISKAVSSVTAPSDTVASAPSGLLVKDIKDLPQLTNKPFIRGVALLNYAELERELNSENNRRMGGIWPDGRYLIGELVKNYGSYQRVAQAFQDDVAGKKKFNRSVELKGASNPYANDNNAFELSKLNDATRKNSMSIYTYTLKTHFKIPDQYVTNGKFVFESDNPGVKNYLRGHVAMDPGSDQGFAQICYERINNDFLHDQKSVYSVKKGNIIDYSITCYFGGDDGTNRSRTDNTIQPIKETNSILPKTWTIHKIKDPLSKSDGASYTLTNKDMFSFENEVYPTK